MKGSVKILFSKSWIIVLLIVFACNEIEEQRPGYSLRSLSPVEVRITGGFWEDFIRISRNNTLPHIFYFCEETNRIENFSRAAGITTGPHTGKRFNDSDLFKAIEGAGYHLQLQRNDTLENYVDSIIHIIAAAQEEDGYLYTPRTIEPERELPGAGMGRWDKVMISHELYNDGHLYEAAIAYYNATGKRELLDVALKNADLVMQVFNEDGLKIGPGHEEIELALVKLYYLTGEKRYLNQALFFLDQRGYNFIRMAQPGTPFDIYNDPYYLQYHLPVREQKEAVGHAVRAMYLYAGMTDAGILISDTLLLEAAENLWNNMISSKLYITGGIGSVDQGEAFGPEFELPNELAYCETCAAVGSILWNHRMFNTHGESKYMDLLETTLYNGFLSGVSLDGRSFFYTNPLQADRNNVRSDWFEVACCPTNVLRLIPSIPGFIYSKNENTLFVNLFIESKAETEFYGKPLRIEQVTSYPLDGKVKLIISPEKPMRFKIQIRIPEWNDEKFTPGGLYKFTDKNWNRIDVRVNGRKAKYGFRGFVVVDKRWKKGDVIEFELPMEPKLVEADDRVECNRNRAAITRGPLVYAVESIDNDDDIKNISISLNDSLSSEFMPDLLNGIELVTCNKIKAIPYYARANRGPADMKVWIPVK